MYSIKYKESFGRGLFAKQNIHAGMIIMQCELLVLSWWETLLVNITGLKYYTFKYNKFQDCLVLDNGELFNHSDNANVRYFLREHEGRKVMMFVANHDIKKGTQLVIDYKADSKININKYLTTLSKGA